jgi:endonuclease-3
VDCVNLAEQIKAAASAGCPLCKAISHSVENYPDTIIEAIIYHRLHSHMEPSMAVKSYRMITSEFVDWNEVRISPIREIQEQVSKGDDSLELSVFIKDFLEFVHARHQSLSLEHLAEENLTEIRRYLKQVRGIDAINIDLILLLRKEHPIIPLNLSMERLLCQLNIVNSQESRDRKEKAVYELVGAESALMFHHLLLDHCRRGVDISDTPYESTKKILSQLAKPHGRGARKAFAKKARSRTKTAGQKTTSAKKAQRKAAKRTKKKK